MIIGRQLRLEDYGASLDGTGIGDDDALEHAIQDAKDGIWSTCRIGWNGDLTLNRKPPKLDRVHLEGDDMAGSKICKKFSGGVLLHFDGRSGYTGGGLHNFSVPSDVGTSNSYIITGAAWKSGDSTYAPDGIQLEHLYLSSGPPERAPFRNIELFGIGRTVPPQGIRGPWIQNVTCFGAKGGNIWIPGIPAAKISGLNTYASTGCDADVYITGSSAFMSEDVRLLGCDIEGILHLAYQRKAILTGSIAKIAWDGPCEYVSVLAASPPVEIGTRPATCRII